VLTSSGPTPIEEISTGDEVLSRTSDGRMLRTRVLKTYRAIRSHYYVINGTIRASSAHSFETSRGWVFAEDLRVGDELVGRSTSPIVVAALERVDYGVRAYNLDVEGDNYLAEGVVSRGPSSGH
jgi:hypothetical protein